MDETKKNLRQQLLPSIIGKNHKTDEGRSVFGQPLRMEELELLSNTVFSRNYQWSQSIFYLLENSYPEPAESEQFLINRNFKTEKQSISLSQKAKIIENYSLKKLKINLASQTGASSWLSVLPLKTTISLRVISWFTSETWMRTTKHSTYTPMWTTVHTHALSTLPKRWIHSTKK